MMSAPNRIVVVDDDPNIQEFAQTFLEFKGYACSVAKNAKDGLDEIIRHAPHCAVIDWILPDQSGIELVARLRQEPSLHRLPILMMSGRYLNPDDLARSIDSGADDFITKPFNSLVFLARIQALIRRASWSNEAGTAGPIWRHHELVLNAAARMVTVNGKPAQLTFAEFELLAFLLRRKKEVLGRAELLAAISPHPETVYHQVVDKHIENLRKKLGPASRYLATVRNVGYRLCDANDA